MEVKLSLQPQPTHPHLSWVTWCYTAGASCSLLILYFIAKYQMSSGPHGPIFDFSESKCGGKYSPSIKKRKGLNQLKFFKSAIRKSWNGEMLSLHP